MCHVSRENLSSISYCMYNFIAEKNLYASWVRMYNLDIYIKLGNSMEILVQASLTTRFSLSRLKLIWEIEPSEYAGFTVNLKSHS